MKHLNVGRWKVFVKEKRYNVEIYIVGNQCSRNIYTNTLDQEIQSYTKVLLNKEQQGT